MAVGPIALAAPNGLAASGICLPISRRRVRGVENGTALTTLASAAMRRNAKVGLESGLSAGLAARRGRVSALDHVISNAPTVRLRCRTTRSNGRSNPAIATNAV